jgi:hypothetical protein
MNSHVFMNGIGDDVYVLDALVDPNLIRVVPEIMSDIHQRNYQQPAMLPDVVADGGIQYEYIPGKSFNIGHNPGCQCPECRHRREKSHVTIYQDLAYLQNADRKFVIDLRTMAFDTHSTLNYNETITLMRLFNSRQTPVLSKRFFIRLLYTMFALDENANVIKTDDGATQIEADIHYYLSQEHDGEGHWTYAFMEAHGSDTIVIPTMYGADQVSLNIRGIEVYARANGHSLTMKDDGSLIYINTGQRDILLYKDTFGIENRGYAYNVMPHDRVKVNFSTLFNNIGFVGNVAAMKDIISGLDYRTLDIETAPSWRGIKMASGTNIIGPDFLPIASTQNVQEVLVGILQGIPLPCNQ